MIFFYLSDIADVTIDNRSLEASPMLINGQPGVDMEIRGRSDANPIKVSAMSNEAVEAIKNNFPQGMKVVTLYDQSVFLSASIEETMLTLMEAIVLVVLVVILFLGSLSLVFALGPGFVSHQQIGIVIVSGLTVGTLFSLLVVPVVYFILKENTPKSVRRCAPEIYIALDRCCFHFELQRV